MIQMVGATAVIDSIMLATGCHRECVIEQAKEDLLDELTNKLVEDGIADFDITDGPLGEKIISLTLIILQPEEAILVNRMLKTAKALSALLVAKNEEEE